MINNSFTLHPSRYFMGILLLLHMGAMLLILTLPLTWWAYLLIAIVLLSSLIYHIEKYVYYRMAKAIKSIANIEGKIWTLTQRNGETINGILQGDSVVTRYLLILNFKIQAENKMYIRRSVVVFNDTMDAPVFRRLRLLCLRKK